MTAAALDFDPSAFVRDRGDGTDEIHLIVCNMHCPSCVRAVEGALGAAPGVRTARLHGSTRRLYLRWDPREAALGDLLGRVTGRGYDLAPYDGAALGDAAAAAEERALVRCMAVAGFAAANVMLISVSVWAGQAQDMGDATRVMLEWVSALIALPAAAYAIRPFLRSALSALRAGRLNMDVPIAVAVSLALALSLHETIRGGPHVYFDAAVTLLFFLLVGRVLDRSLRRRVGSAAENLLALQAPSARLAAPDGTVRTVPIAEVRPGCRVLIAAGERVPVDGVIAEGAAGLDDSLITGETAPRAAAAGDPVHAGTVALSGPIVVTVSASEDDTLLAEIARLVAVAEQGRARYVRLADRVAGWYAPVVHGLAAAAFVGWLAAGLDWQQALMIATAVLIVTCPCALGLAVPAVQVGAVGRLMRAGVLARSGDGLERLAAVDRVVLDKTGTVTLGRPRLETEGIPEEALRLAAGLCAASRHPLARTVAAACPDVPRVGDVTEHPGAGLEARREGTVLRFGSADFVGLADHRPPAAPGAEAWLRIGDAAPIRFAFADLLREDARDAVAGLASRGLPVELLSGDRAAAAGAVAAAVGIADWRAGCRPADKVDRLRALEEAGHRVLMVGDGLNDAPSLAAAHAAMSPGTAIGASQTLADFVFLGDRLGAVVEAVDVARRAQRLVIQNIALAVLYNAVAVPLAIAGVVTPLIAAIAMSGSSLAVTLNALRIRLGAAPAAGRPAPKPAPRVAGEPSWSPSSI